jgi:hypothetical protein
MPTYKEIRFKLDGKINGVDMTPTTTPMARLAEYLTDLAALLGHKEAVHFIGVEDGSTQPVIIFDADEEARITHRVQLAERGQGPREANNAFKRIDQRLREDQGHALINISGRPAPVIEFPGIKKPVYETYGPLRESASIIGQLIRVGGTDETIPIWLQREDESMLFCNANQAVAEQLAPYYRKHIRVHGFGVWIRVASGAWKLEKFKIQSFDPEPVLDRSVMSTVESLKALPTDWKEVEDPLEELRRLRHGEAE